MLCLVIEAVFRKMGQKCTKGLCRKRGVSDKVYFNPFWVKRVKNFGKQCIWYILVQCVLNVFKYRSKVSTFVFKGVRVILRK